MKRIKSSPLLDSIKGYYRSNIEYNFCEFNHHIFSLIGKFVQGISKKYQDKLAEASAVAEESVGNIRTVRSFSQEPKTMTKYAEGIHKSYLLGAKLAVASGEYSVHYQTITHYAMPCHAILTLFVLL